MSGKQAKINSETTKFCNVTILSRMVPHVLRRNDTCGQQFRPFRFNPSVSSKHVAVRLAIQVSLVSFTFIIATKFLQDGSPESDASRTRLRGHSHLAESPCIRRLGPTELSTSGC